MQKAILLPLLLLLLLLPSYSFGQSISYFNKSLRLDLSTGISFFDIRVEDKKKVFTNTYVGNNVNLGLTYTLNSYLGIGLSNILLFERGYLSYTLMLTDESKVMLLLTNAFVNFHFIDSRLNLNIGGGLVTRLSNHSVIEQLSPSGYIEFNYLIKVSNNVYIPLIFQSNIVFWNSNVSVMSHLGFGISYRFN